MKQFLESEYAGGTLLILSAILAMVCANTALSGFYELLLSTPMVIQVGALEIAKPILLWVNDGLMAIFFFLVGLELKREVVEGQLSDPRNVILPAVGAIGGMLAPALVYVYFNHKDPVAMNGWAIPAATDIAFALGVLSLLGSRVSTSIKVFLTSLAIFDDVGAVIIIAIFYTAKISTTALIIVGFCIPILYVLNRIGVSTKTPFIAIGLVMWIATLKSGVHATLAGVLLAMFIPMYSKDKKHSPLKELEHDLHSFVAFVVLPVFAFANSGISLGGLTMESVFHPVPIGIALGLFIGKQVGIFTLCGALIRLGWVPMPKGMNWLTLYGTAALCGIGFTMSLFIGSLAFEESGVNVIFDERLGIVVGSMMSGAFGLTVLNFGLKKKAAASKDQRSEVESH